jgi:hypothetical protein
MQVLHTYSIVESFTAITIQHYNRRPFYSIIYSLGANVSKTVKVCIIRMLVVFRGHWVTGEVCLLSWHASGTVISGSSIY